ncbi:MAG TPA: hypothetical protein VFJ66_02710 [Gaiellales bacterium]|nr:hypothetical protein [Gaiellales bacterium]
MEQTWTFGWLRDWRLWAAVSVACVVADVALVYAATRISMPAVGCTAPLPSTQQQLLQQWIDAVDQVVAVANWFAVGSVAALVAGFAVSRSRPRLFLIVAPVLVVVLVAHSYSGDITGAWCADN